METFEIFLEGYIRKTVTAYDYRINGIWVEFFDVYRNKVAIVNINRVIAIYPIYKEEAEDEEAEE